MYDALYICNTFSLKVDMNYEHAVLSVSRKLSELRADVMELIDAFW